MFPLKKTGSEKAHKEKKGVEPNKRDIIKINF
jgi:hypothetical protein